MPIIDFHNHYYPPVYLEALRSGSSAVEVTVDEDGNPRIYYPGDDRCQRSEMEVPAKNRVERTLAHRDAQRGLRIADLPSRLELANRCRQIARFGTAVPRQNDDASRALGRGQGGQKIAVIARNAAMAAIGIAQQGEQIHAR